MTIFILKDGNRTGPFTIEQVVETVRKGNLLMTDLAWHEGLSEWVALHTIKQVVDTATPPIPEAQTKPAIEEDVKYIRANTAMPSETKPFPFKSKPIWDVLGGVLLILVSVGLFSCYVAWWEADHNPPNHYEIFPQQTHQTQPPRKPPNPKFDKNTLLIIAIFTFGYGVKCCFFGLNKEN